MQGLEGRRILITGGSRGIGLALARAAVEAGARVVITGRSEGPLRAAADDLSVFAVAADVADEAQARRSVAEARERLGGIDVLVNNAGVGEFQRVEDIDLASCERVWRTNVLGAIAMTREVVRVFREQGMGGDVVNISSTAGLRGFEGGTAYVASKFALRGISECWRAELRRHDVRVMLVNPSEVQTGFGRHAFTGEPNPKKLVPEDIAHAIVSALTMHPRGFIPELSVFATNPWD